MATSCILQLNIRSWDSNKYYFEVDLHNYSPDVILLNETSSTHNNIKLKGYYVMQFCEERYSGVAILVKNNLKFSIIPTHTKDTLAIKLHTTLGPIIISTSYIPPRQTFIPTITLNKILDHNLPTIFISDYNAKHPIFHNTTNYNRYGNPRGAQLASLVAARDLDFLGPQFSTYQTRAGKGTPDLIITNKQFRMFHHLISKGNNVCSDHFPIILKFSTLPIKIANTNKHNIKSLNIPNYKIQLERDVFPNLNHQPVARLDEVVETIFNNINSALSNNCNNLNIYPVKSYQPTPQIKLKIKQLQVAYNSYLNFGYPNNVTLNNYKNQLLNLITNHKCKEWESIVKIASECHGQPEKFWKHIKRLMGDDSTPPSHLVHQYVFLADSEDDDFGEMRSEEIIEPQDKVEFMRKTWKKIFKPHNINNPHTRRVDHWFESNKQLFLHDNIINFDNLVDGDPLLRPVSEIELKKSIAFTRDKSPGLSGIGIVPIKNLPPNYHNLIISLYNAIIASKYWPMLFKKSKMVFAPKPGKSLTDPLNYRPISLLEILAKILERIINNRLLFYLEYNNILPPNQFGFRPGRSTQHSIEIARECIKESQAQGKTVLISTRDVAKAFDTVWLQGLIYKINVTLQINIHFSSIIYNYVFDRLILPTFENRIANNFFTPKAGVPQGSCLGPILFLIYVHDSPKPFYRDTLVFQFADDVVHIIRSDTVSRNRATDAQNKITIELERTLRWENKWKIKTSWDKSYIGYCGTSIETLENIGGININGNPIQITNEIKMLGYTFNHYMSSTPHVRKLAPRASHNIAKLYRFRSAPVKIKRYLYITLIRPLLEYPCIELNNSGTINKSTLQKLQNKALRFILNIKLNDRIRSETMHERAKLDPINVRLAKLARRMLYKMKALYVDADEDLELAPYARLAIDLNLENLPDPHNPPPPSIYNSVRDAIFNDGYGRTPNLLTLPEDFNTFPIPPPIFS